MSSSNLYKMGDFECAYIETTCEATGGTTVNNMTLTNIYSDEMKIFSVNLLDSALYGNDSDSQGTANEIKLLEFSNGSYLLGRFWINSYGMQGEFFSVVPSQNWSSPVGVSSSFTLTTELISKMKQNNFIPRFFMYPIYYKNNKIYSQGDPTITEEWGFACNINWYDNSQKTDYAPYNFVENNDNLYTTSTMSSLVGSVLGQLLDGHSDNMSELGDVIYYTDGSPALTGGGSPIHEYQWTNNIQKYESTPTNINSQYHGWIWYFITPIGSNNDSYLNDDYYNTDDDNTPYNKGGDSEPDGGDGGYDFTSDGITPEPLPTLSLCDSGFISIYNPTEQQIKQIANYVWSTNAITNLLTTIYGSVAEGIMSLHIVPVAIPNAIAQSFTIVGVTSPNIMVNMPTSQFVSFDCGSITISEFTGSALDYLPYTKMEIYLPYIGVREISTDECMGKIIHLTYKIDISTGALVAFIQCDGQLMYQFAGNCAVSIPITSLDRSNIIKSTLNSIMAGGTMMATGSPTAMIGGLNQLASNITNSKSSIKHSGDINGTTGLLSHQTPYITINTPRQCLPQDYKNFSGYPSHMTYKLSDLTGYTQVEEIQLKNTTATKVEKDEIYKLLKEGVII